MQATSGASACDGTAALDLNALWTTKPWQAPAAGIPLQAQFWYRDPASTAGQETSLSDAIELTPAP